MTRKPGSMYRQITQQAYTRRKYMGGVPPSRITQFVVGNKTEKFPIQLCLTANERCQIRHNALEAARITANRFLEKKAGATDYRLTVRVYPHHVYVKTNKQLVLVQTVFQWVCEKHLEKQLEPQQELNKIRL